MLLNDKYYTDFLLSKKMSEPNKENIRFAISQGDDLELSYVQLLEAMLITEQYPQTKIEYTVAGVYRSEVFTPSREDIVFLLNSLVCTTEFLPTKTEPYKELRQVKSDAARFALLRQFKKYLWDSASNKNSLAH